MNKKKSVIMLLIMIVCVAISLYPKTNIVKVEGKELYSSSTIHSKPICILDINNTIKLGKSYQGRVMCTGEGKMTDKIELSSFKQSSLLIKKVKILSVSKGYYEGNFYIIPFTYKATFIGDVDIYLESGKVIDEYNQLNPSTRTYRIKIKLF